MSYAICKECIYTNYIKLKQITPRKASLAIVGEAPLPTEARSGKLFNSPAGTMLKKTMIREGIDISVAYATMALKCSPPQGKAISKTAIMKCRKGLITEMLEVNPKVILALGNTAIHALTGDTSLKITQVQGSVIESPELPGVKIFPVFSPAKILRAPGEFKVFRLMISNLAQLVNEGSAKDPGETTYDVCFTEEDVLRSIQVLKNKAKTKPNGILLAGADLETTGLNRYTDEVLVMGLAYEKNKVFVYDEAALPFIYHIFEIPELRFIWHHGKFDLGFLKHDLGIHTLLQEDLLYAHYCLNETSGTHDLEQLSVHYVGAQSYKHEADQYIKSKEGFRSANKEIIYKRVAIDADYTLQAYNEIIKEVNQNPGLVKLYREILIPAANYLRNIEDNGMLIDQNELRALKVHYGALLEELLDKISECVGDLWNRTLYMRQTGAKSAPERFNPNSPKQLAWLLWDVLRIKSPKRGRSTGKEILKEIIHAHPVIPLIQEYRMYKKEMGTYVEGIEKRLGTDGRIRSTFNLHITATGRLSSKDPNLQNIPSRREFIKKMFIAPPGRVLMEVDYKGAELRMLALMSGDINMKRVFQEGRDLHTEVSVANNLSRIRAKALNFGIPYGREKYSIADELDITPDEAQDMIDGWAKQFPQAWEFLQQCAKAVEEGRSLVSPFGRMRRFGLVTPDTLHDLQNEARNFLIQSTTSDLTLLAGMKLEPELREKYDALTINTVHDSIIYELPDDPEIIKAVAKRATEVMMEIPIKHLNSDVPFEVEIEIGKRWRPMEKYTGHLEEVGRVV